MADGDEQPLDFDGGFFAGLGVLEQHALDTLLAHDVNDDFVPEHLGIGSVEDAFLHGLGSPEFIATVNDDDFGGELREKAGFFHRRVAAPHDRQYLIAKDRQRSVTHGARADPAPGLGESEFVFQSDPVGGRAAGDDDGMGLDRLAPGIGQREGLGGKIAVIDVAPDNPRAEPFGLLLKHLHHFRSRHAIRKTGVVLDFGGEHELPAGQDRSGILLRHPDVADGGKVGSGGVDRGGPAGRAAADDDKFLDVRHMTPDSLRVRGSSGVGKAGL